MSPPIVRQGRKLKQFTQKFSCFSGEQTSLSNCFQSVHVDGINLSPRKIDTWPVVFIA